MGSGDTAVAKAHRPHLVLAFPGAKHTRQIKIRRYQKIITSVQRIRTEERTERI